MSLSVNIRGALQQRAILATGFPASNQRAFDGVEFNPTNGTAWARLSFLPQTSRAFSVSGAVKEHRGLFQVSLFYPAGTGTNTGETAADAVKAQFTPGLRLQQGGETIVIDYAELAPSIQEPDWISFPVTVAYRAFSVNN